MKRRLHAVAHTELLVDMAEMHFDGDVANEQLPGDFFVREAVCD